MSRKILKKIIKNGVTYYLPEGGGGGDLDIETVIALADYNNGEYDKLFMLKNGLYKILNGLSDEDELGLTEGEDWESIVGNATSMSKISHGYSVMCYLANSEYGMNVVKESSNGMKELSECWNSVSIIEECEEGRNIYLSSDYFITNYVNYQTVQDAFSKYIYENDKVFLASLEVESLLDSIVATSVGRNKIEGFTPDDLLPAILFWTELSGYSTYNDLVGDSEAKAVVLANTNAMKIISNNFMANFLINPTPLRYNYTGQLAPQVFTAPLSGRIIIEVWGAEGGGATYHTYAGGKGGYSNGFYNVNAGDKLYIYVGGKGGTGSYGGLNGGGGYYGGGNGTHTGSGGGATDVSLVGGNMRTDSYARYIRDEASYNGRIIVAGGGGGGSYGAGQPGGGTNGGSYGGTQTAAGSVYSNSWTTVVTGAKGYGASVYGNIYNHSCAGCGGGGYYGGGAMANTNNSTRYSGGGSGYIGGVSSGVMYSGNQSFLSPDGVSETGHSGNGCCIITYV